MGMGNESGGLSIITAWNGLLDSHKLPKNLFPYGTEAIKLLLVGINSVEVKGPIFNKLHQRVVINELSMLQYSLAWPAPIPHRGKGSGIWA